MDRKCFDIDALGCDQAAEQFEKDLSELRQARKLRPCPSPELLPWVSLLQRHGMRKFFSYSQLAETLAVAGGPRIERLKLRRFIAKYLPEVFKFRSQFKFNRSVAIAKDNQNEC